MKFSFSRKQIELGAMGGEMVSYAVELTEPSFDGVNLSYQVDGIGDTALPTALRCDTPSELFIDSWDSTHGCDVATVKGLGCGCTGCGIDEGCCGSPRTPNVGLLKCTTICMCAEGSLSGACGDWGAETCQKPWSF